MHYLLRFYQPRINNKVFSVDTKGGVKNPKNLEQVKTLGRLVAKTLIKRKERAKKYTTQKLSSYAGYIVEFVNTLRNNAKDAIM